MLFISENSSPKYRTVSEKLSFKNSKSDYKECMGSLTFLPSRNFTVLDGCYTLFFERELTGFQTQRSKVVP